MMKVFVWLLLFHFLISGQTGEDVAVLTQGKLRSLQSIKANFEQLFFDIDVPAPLKEKGIFYYKRPFMMKWEYKEPEQKIWINNKDQFQFYIAEENTLWRGAVPQEGHEAEILHILSGTKKISTDYLIEFSPFPTENKNVWQLKLTPREEGEYSYILLEIQQKSHLILKAVFFDWAGNKQEFRFSKIKTNIQLSQETFLLKLPPDVEIIEN